MMETKDFVSGFIGFALAVLGALPLLAKVAPSSMPPWFSLSWFPVQIAAYILAVAGFYLMINSVIEITNSNSIGWMSFLIAVIVMAVGILQVLHKFNIGPDFFELKFIKDTFYYVIFLVQGIFLMIAMFAMEL
ncbi:hypothetical protein J4206_05250 [Candidatus Woesearchaeota archaeon]|nr:hypothetical protein [Candidatus Woesearchaeota archaeon]